MNFSKTDNKIIKFKKNFDLSTEIAYDRSENGDFVGALSVLFGEEKNTKNADIYAHIADVYTQMGSYETAIKYWYTYLSKSEKKYYCDGYNGLGANFFMLGNDSIAGYYFNRQIESGSGDGCVYEDVFEDYLDSLMDNKISSYKIVYPTPQSDVDKQRYEDGKSLLENKDYANANSLLSEIGDKSEYYLKALVERAYALFYLEKTEEAFSLIKTALDGGEINLYSLTLAINICAIDPSLGDLGAYLDLLFSYKDFSDEDKYRKLNLLINLNLKSEALEYSYEIEKLSPYEANVLFLRAILLYNMKDYLSASECFRNSYILTMNPIAKFYYDIAQKALSGEVIYRVLKPSFILPEKEVQRRLSLLKDIYEQSSSFGEIQYPQDFCDIAKWTFYTDDSTTQLVTAIILARGKTEEFMRILQEMLIEPIVSDEVKNRVISIMCENDCFGKTFVVYGYIFREINIPKNKFIEQGGDLFQKAHAYAFGRMSMIDGKKLAKLTLAALKLQRKLVESGNIEKVRSVVDLACAIYKYSAIDIFTENGVEYDYFNTDEQRVKEILEMVK